MADTITDAAGQPLEVGDTVGGTTSGRYQATVVGTVAKIGTTFATVTVTDNSRAHGSHKPGDQVRMSLDRLFRIRSAAQCDPLDGAERLLRQGVDLHVYGESAPGSPLTCAVWTERAQEWLREQGKDGR